MKGLILKDFYMAKKYCRAYLLIVVVFIAVSFFSEDNMLFGMYPCLLSGMIPVTLLGYDERSKWMEYSGTLPYTKAQIVSGKYLVGLITQISVFVLIGVVQGIRMNMSGIFVWDNYLILMATFLIMSCVLSSITLPCMFRWGVEKGRIAYYVMIGLFFAICYIASAIFGETLQVTVAFDGLWLLICMAGIAIYVLSWYLSVVFYKRKENF